MTEMQAWILLGLLVGALLGMIVGSELSYQRFRRNMRNRGH